MVRAHVSVCDTCKLHVCVHRALLWLLPERGCHRPAWPQIPFQGCGWVYSTRPCCQGLDMLAVCSTVGFVAPWMTNTALSPLAPLAPSRKVSPPSGWLCVLWDTACPLYSSGSLVASQLLLARETCPLPGSTYRRTCHKPEVRHLMIHSGPSLCPE